MHTKVISIRMSKKQPIEVYIGRAGHGNDGYFGNPVAIGRKCPICGLVHNTGGSTLPCYTKYLIQKLQDSEFKNKVKGLHGKTLVCFCKPNPCHGDVLAYACEYLNHPGEGEPLATHDMHKLWEVCQK